MNTAPPYPSFRAYLRDVLIGFLLIIGGFLLAGAITPPIQLVVRWSIAYPIALAIGLLPFCYFARWARVVSFDRFDLVVVMVLGVLVSACDQAFSSPIAFVVFGVCYYAYGAVRKKWFPNEPADEPQS
jgi:hypothetical protein